MTMEGIDTQAILVVIPAPSVIPAKAGIQETAAKTPNGTRLMPVCYKPIKAIPCNDDGRDRHTQAIFVVILAPSVIPAKAGIQETEPGQLMGAGF